MWKPSIANALDHNFLGWVYHDRQKEFYNIGNEIKSSLPLQMALYFNVWLLPIWFLISLINLDAKYYNLSDVYKFITVTIFCILSILECVRLYLGYLGNLAEKIPELASFWLISTLIQFPLEMFLLLDNGTQLELSEIITNSLMLCFLIIEIVAGTVTLKISANQHTKRLYIAQLYGTEDSVR